MGAYVHVATAKIFICYLEVQAQVIRLSVRLYELLPRI